MVKRLLPSRGWLMSGGVMVAFGAARKEINKSRNKSLVFAKVGSDKDPK
jgi:hypothetical protein